MCHNVKRGLKNKNATKVLTIQKEVGNSAAKKGWALSKEGPPFLLPCYFFLMSDR
jgi:hypothetical protein